MSVVGNSVARATRTAALGAFVTLVAAVVAPSLPSCGEHFEPPCRVTEQRVVLPASTIGPRRDAIALSEGANGDIVISWSAIDARLTGDGASDGGDARDAGDASASDGGDAGAEVSKFTAPQASIAVVSADGATRLMHTFLPPAALAARRGSTTSPGATFVGDGVLFHWVETSTTTRPDGTTATTEASKLQRVGLDGREGPLVADPAFACAACSIATAFASFGAITAVIVNVAPDGSSARPFPSRTVLVTLDANGARTASFDLAQLAGESGSSPAAPPLGSQGLSGGAAGAQPMKLFVRDGRFIAIVGRTAAVFDDKLSVVQGPWSLPTPGAEIDVVGREVDVLWSGSLSSVGDGGVTSNVGGQPDLLFESRSASGPPRIAPVRISTTARIGLVRRNEGRAGVLHASAGQNLFTLVGEDGRKIGGDHPLGSNRDSALPEHAEGEGISLANGSFDPSARSQLLFPAGRTHFVAWTASNDVLREVITCAP